MAGVTPAHHASPAIGAAPTGSTASTWRDRWLSRPAWLLGALVCVAGWVRVWYLVARPETAIGVVPDDAFYYLKLAHNRAVLGWWTFDGVSPTSGFHLLHAYLLTAMDAVPWYRGDSWPAAFVLVGVLASVCLGVATALTVLTAQRAFGSRCGWWAGPIVLGPPFVMLSTMMMESHLVVLAAAVTLYAASRTDIPSTAGQVGLVALGLVSSTTRSDFVLFPLLLWAAMALHRRTEAAGYRRTSLLLAGSLAGMACTAAHTLIVSGTLLQSSVRTKLAWAQGGSAGAWVLITLLNVAVFVLVAGYAVTTRRRSPSITLLSQPLTLACLLTIIGYGAAYSLAGEGLQPWYAASLMVPLAFVACAIGARLPGRRPHLVGLVATLAALALTTGQLGQQLWPWQVGMMHAAERLQTMPEIDHFGSWNAGILGVLSGKQVTNLDGLVDDEAARANQQNRLLEYLQHRQIEYVVDHADAPARPEGNRPDERLLRCLEPVQTLGNASDPFSGTGPVTLFRLRPHCR